MPRQGVVYQKSQTAWERNSFRSIAEALVNVFHFTKKPNGIFRKDDLRGREIELDRS